MRIAGRAVWPENEADSAQLEGAVWTAHVAVTADARIDNEIELRAVLGVEREASVAALLGCAYLKWDMQLPLKLTGDFAILVWDAIRRRLLAFRDPFGVRPLFYRSEASNQIRLASQIEQLVERKRELTFDDTRIIDHLLGSHTAPERTFFSEIREVPPGHVLIASASGVTSYRYWSPTIHLPDSSGTRGEYGREFRRLFIQAVERRLLSDRPVMIHVSGGLDSSSIACVGDVLFQEGRSIAPSILGVAATYPGLTCDESVYIDAVARKVSFPIVRWDDTKTDFADLVDPALDEPGIRSIFRGGSDGDTTIARNHGGSVILGGLGGDQIGIVEGFVKDLIQNYRWGWALRELVSFPGATVSVRMKRTLRILKQFVPESLARKMGRGRQRIPNWIAKRLRPLAEDCEPYQVPPIAGVSSLQEFTWRRVMAAETLRNVSMMNIHASAQQTEYRFPFLDKDLVLFVLSIPYEFWPRPGAYVRFHREALADLLPSEILGRFGKAEFTPALGNKVKLAGRLILSLFDGEWASSRYVDRDAASQFCSRVLSFGSDAGALAWRQVWAVATLEAWMRKILGYHPRAKGNLAHDKRYLGRSD